MALEHSDRIEESDGDLPEPDPVPSTDVLIPWAFGVGAVIMTIAGLWAIQHDVSGGLRTTLNWLVLGWMLMATAIALHLSRSGSPR